MRRREFVVGMAGAAAWPVAARAQQPAIPVIGFLSSASAETFVGFVGAFRDGLAEAGYVEGQNVNIEYRWADNEYLRLPALAGELVARRVAVIVASGGNISALAARAATTTIPVVFTAVSDPVKGGLVESLSRPGGNVTGVAGLTAELDAVRLQILRELVPTAATIGALINPNRLDGGTQERGIKAAAESIGQKVLLLRAATEDELENAFEKLNNEGIAALLVAADPLFNSQSRKIVALAAHYRIPVIYSFRPAGGLVSYGTNLADAYRQAAFYTSRILNGEKPADLPVVQPTKFELVINLKTAKQLGLTVPESFLLRADEVIE
jgi:putative ABC transport system substrate-binding protein